ncbi:MAG TPA: ribonuclease H family protein [Bacteroidales bacterium]|jgi:ribonuclease HI|nr:ribonuclease H family protein [Bacteroidales bacterium]
MAKKYYVVWKGHQTGIFTSWNMCKPLIEGYKGAVYKSFDTYEEAKEAFENQQSQTIRNQHLSKKQRIITAYPIQDSLAVDAACSGNPGPMEYRGVYVKTGQELFKIGPLQDGTNNIGEFLAIVHGLAYLQKIQSNIPIYTDSVTALSWIKNKHCKTTVSETSRNEKIFELIDRAEHWLTHNTYNNQILKWDTQHWGEIPADFGRK